jgi:BlaI family transcriptional regulator, penicillinase repressor
MTPIRSARPTRPNPLDVGRRERQIIELVYQLGKATVADVLSRLPDPPSYSAVRAMLGKLEDKGYLSHEQDGPRYVYIAAVPAERARRTALRQVVDTFFGGSVEQAVLALVKLPEGELPDDRLAALAERIRRAREEGR